jgi:hypothetical protein
MRKVVIALRGPADRVARAEGEIRAWAMQFQDNSGGAGVGV